MYLVSNSAQMASLEAQNLVLVDIWEKYKEKLSFNWFEICLLEADNYPNISAFKEEFKTFFPDSTLS